MPRKNRKSTHNQQRLATRTSTPPNRPPNPAKLHPKTTRIRRKTRTFAPTTHPATGPKGPKNSQINRKLHPNRAPVPGTPRKKPKIALKSWKLKTNNPGKNPGKRKNSTKTHPNRKRSRQNFPWKIN